MSDECDLNPKNRAIARRYAKDQAERCAPHPRHDANVAHPAHYTSHPSGVECVELSAHMDFLVGNAFKYIWRAGLKDDKTQDLEKALWYIDRALDERHRHPRWEAMGKVHSAGSFSALWYLFQAAGLGVAKLMLARAQVLKMLAESKGEVS